MPNDITLTLTLLIISHCNISCGFTVSSGGEVLMLDAGSLFFVS